MRLHHISGDEIVFIYDHSQETVPRVGDSYYVREVGGEEALVAQIVALETFNYPSLGEVVMRQIMEESYGPKQVQTFAEPSNAPQVDNLGQARAKIRRRRMSDGQWGIWNGWLPSRNVDATRVDDEELFARCGLLDPNYPLTLGTTLDGRKFAIEGRTFEKINVITALKGMGKSHLAKVLILQLIERGMGCVVFDVNREYNRLPALQASNGEVTEPGTIVLSASRNFRVTIEGFGRRAFIRMFEQFNPTENTRNRFELEVNRAFDRLEQIDEANRRVPPERQRPRPFFNLELIRSLFPAPPGTNEAVYRAIMDRLDQIEGLNLFAETVQEGASFAEQYELCAQRGGALVVDLAPLSSRFARETFVGATLDMVEHVAANSASLPFVFFEEAHLYASGNRIDNLVTRARHLGITSTFVTNMVTQLNETVLRQVDNLFLLYLPHRDDVRHVAKSATTDEETVSAFAQRIERHHAMIVGNATAQYPIVFRVDSREDIEMAGQTRFAFPE
jgi:uncharacterized protein